MAALQSIDHRIGDGELLPEYDAALRAAGWTEKDLTHIACVMGPGGFTSLRVAVAFANTLAHTLKIPSAGIHLSDLYRARTDEKDFLWLHSTKAKEIFVRGFGVFAKEWSEAIDVKIDAMLEKIAPKTSWAGELLETHRALLEGKNLKAAPLRPLTDVLPLLLNNLPYERSLIKPWYGREG